MRLFDATSPCLLVIPASPSQSTTKAAALLKSCFAAITGKSFPICPEDRVEIGDEGFKLDGKSFPAAIWLGGTERALKEGMTADELTPDGFKIRTGGNSVFLVGRDSNEKGKDCDGTKNAAAFFLERYLGARWLWPGDLGKVLPKRESIVIDAEDIRNEPAIRQRIIRDMGINESGLRALAKLNVPSGEKIYQKTLDEAREWLSFQRTGSSLRLVYAHAFGDWWEKYGATHLDWFALQKNGSRKQNPERPRLCKGNPEVAHQAALQTLEFYRNNPDADCAPISLNDGGNNSFCMCPLCRRLDPPNGEKIKLTFRENNEKTIADYPSLSDRMATFFNRIAEEVVKEMPSAKLGTYAYSAYRDAPLGVSYHPSILVGFVGFSYFDRAQREGDLTRWNGLCSKASQLFLRPNTFHIGESIPAVFVHQMGSDIRHCYETGMMAADFDSLLGNWATQGLNYYVLAKLLWDPFADVDALVKDYCVQGFGAAAEHIEAFFRLLEKGTAQVAEMNSQLEERQLREEEQDIIPKTRAFKTKTPFRNAVAEVYSPEFFTQLKKQLTRAKEAANGDSTILSRIEFLADGVEFGELQAALFRAFQKGGEGENERARILAYYRRALESQPLAVNPVYRLSRDRRFYEAIP